MYFAAECKFMLCLLVVDRIRLSEPQSPGSAWFLDQLISVSTVTKLLFDLLSDADLVSTCLSLKVCALTLSLPIPLKRYTLPYWSNPPFLIFDIWALWRSGVSARAPECQKSKMAG